MLEDTVAGSVEVIGCGPSQMLSVVEAIKQGHKVAVRPIACGEAVVKFGVAIGTASSAILTGQWVHLHNCQSLVDQRSGTLDLHTGAATDTRYE
jgi:altronate dehydratase